MWTGLDYKYISIEDTMCFIINSYLSPLLTQLKPGIHLPQLRQHTHYIQPRSDKGLETVIHNHSTGLMDISITFTRQSNYSISDDHTNFVSDNQFRTQPVTRVMTTQGSVVRSQRLSQYHPIAPPSLNALLIHQRQPITQNTYITGQKYNN